jgi:hypothetical protein
MLAAAVAAILDRRRDLRVMVDVVVRCFNAFSRDEPLI